MQIGVVGLPNAGKSTLFNMLVGSGAETGVYPFTTVDSNVGDVPVPDHRLEPVCEAIGSETAFPALVRVVDIAGLVEGASAGEGLGNRFLSYIREVDAIAHVVRAFERPDVSHSEGEVDPLRDVNLIESELLLKDLETLNNREQRAQRRAKSGNEEDIDTLTLVQSLKERVEGGQYLMYSDISDEEYTLAQEMHLLTCRPVLYLINVDEQTAAEKQQGEKLPEYVKPVINLAEERGMLAIVLCASFEEELTQLDPQEREMFRSELGIEEDGRERFIKVAHELLGLITFFTGNDKETRARSIPEGSSAQDAAGKVHSDMAEGFIRADVINAENLIEIGSRSEAIKHGVVRSEGKDYVVQDGDVLEIHFRS